MTSTTNTEPSPRERAIEQAQEHLIAVLDGSRSPYEDGERELRLLGDLVSTASELRGLAKRTAGALDDAVSFVSGGRGRMNNLGILQGDATRIDACAALFSYQADLAKRALVDHYLALSAAPDEETTS